MEINLNNMSHSKAKTLGETYDNVLELEKSILEFRATIRVPPKGETLGKVTWAMMDIDTQEKAKDKDDVDITDFDSLKQFINERHEKNLGRHGVKVPSHNKMIDAVQPQTQGSEAATGGAYPWAGETSDPWALCTPCDQPPGLDLDAFGKSKGKGKNQGGKGKQPLSCWNCLGFGNPSFKCASPPGAGKSKMSPQYDICKGFGHVKAQCVSQGGGKAPQKGKGKDKVGNGGKGNISDMQEWNPHWQQHGWPAAAEQQNQNTAYGWPIVTTPPAASVDPWMAAVMSTSPWPSAAGALTSSVAYPHTHPPQYSPFQQQQQHPQQQQQQAGQGQQQPLWSVVPSVGGKIRPMSMLAMGGKAKRDVTGVSNSFVLLKDREDGGASRETGQEERDREPRVIIGEDGNTLSTKVSLGQCAKIMKGRNKPLKPKKEISADKSMDSFMKSSQFAKLLGTKQKYGEVVISKPHKSVPMRIGCSNSAQVTEPHEQSPQQHPRPTTLSSTIEPDIPMHRRWQRRFVGRCKFGRTLHSQCMFEK